MLVIESHAFLITENSNVCVGPKKRPAQGETLRLRWSEGDQLCALDQVGPHSSQSHLYTDEAAISLQGPLTARQQKIIYTVIFLLN